MAHYTGADGRRWSRSLVSFLGAMCADVKREYSVNVKFTVNTDAWRKSMDAMEAGKVEPEEAPAVPEPDVAEATAGLPAGWREVWARGARVTVRGSMDGSDIPFHVHVDGCRFLSVESMDTAIHYADKWYPATNYPD